MKRKRNSNSKSKTLAKAYRKSLVLQRNRLSLTDPLREHLNALILMSHKYQRTK